MTGIPYNSWRLEWAFGIVNDGWAIEWAFVNYAQNTVYRKYIIENQGKPFRSDLYSGSIDNWHRTPGLAPKDIILTRIYDANV